MQSCKFRKGIARTFRLCSFGIGIKNRTAKPIKENREPKGNLIRHEKFLKALLEEKRSRRSPRQSYLDYIE